MNIASAGLTETFYQFDMTGRLELDQYESKTIVESLKSYTDFTENIVERKDDLCCNVFDLKKSREKLEKYLKAALKLAKVNDLPKHFVEAFDSILTDAIREVETIQGLNFEEITEQLQSDLWSIDCYD